MNRILVIRGGAIGDFILTLPALATLRQAHPRAEIHVLGYQHIAELVNKRVYADCVRSIEYGPLASFFAKNSELPSELANYFAGFQLILTYLYDPDRIFEINLRRCGLEEILCGPAKLSGQGHAAWQLGRPLEQLGLRVDDLRSRLYPSREDRAAGQDYLKDLSPPILAMHPGSGSEQKNWPIENWIQLGNEILAGNPRNGGFQAADDSNGRFGNRPSLIVVAGEADEAQTNRLQHEWRDQRVHFAKNLPLPHLAAVLENTIFVGHDSGISHLAAAAGAKCTLLFGPTDPDVWAPKGENVRVIPAPDGDLSRLNVADVLRALARWERP
jgi:heptosyltransferase-3